MPLPQRVQHQTVAFVLVGLAVAAFGHVVLGWLVATGMTPWLANAVQIVLALQLKVLGNRFLTWRIREVATRLGATRSVVNLEPDAVAADCFDAVRAATLAAATRLLSQAGHYVYLDAGHAGWRSSGEMAEASPGTRGPRGASP